MDLEDLRVFLVVVDTGSVIAAAKRLGITRSRLRRRVESLESDTGTALLHRTALGTTPTEAGRTLAAEGAEILADADDLVGRLRGDGAMPRGRLRIVGTPGMPPEVLSMALGLMRAHVPEVRLHLDLHPDGECLLPDEADIAIVLKRRPAEASHVAFVLKQVQVQLLATPAYLAARGRPGSLEDLGGHDLFSWASSDWDPDVLPLRSGATFRATPAAVIQNILELRHCAEQSLCIALAPEGLPGPEPHLVPVLPDLVGAEIPLWMVFPEAVARLPKVRALIESARAVTGSLVEAALSPAASE